MNTLSRKAYESFKAAVADGRIAMGETYTQNELCALLGTSLNPLREALKLLEHEGFLDVKARSGIKIWRPTMQSVHECYQIRRMFEVEGMQRYAISAKLEDLHKVRERQAEHRQAALDERPLDEILTEQQEIENVLHGGAVRALNNRIILDIYRVTMEKIWLIRLERGGYYHGLIVDTAKEHTKIIDAMIARDPESAQSALKEHLDASLNRALLSGAPFAEA